MLGALMDKRVREEGVEKLAKLDASASEPRKVVPIRDANG